MPTGGCLCGAVRYEVRGPLRDVLICHCVECRRWHGHFSASTAERREDLVLLEQRGLRWIQSPDSDAGARRGFCAECGSSLFGDPAGDYYDLPDDGLPRHEHSAQREQDRSA